MDRVFCLPDLGEGLAEAQIHAWCVEPGAWIEKGMPLVTVETAKALVDIPAPYTGYVAVCHSPVGSVVPTGAPLVTFGENAADSMPAGEELQGVVGRMAAADPMDIPMPVVSADMPVGEAGVVGFPACSARARAWLQRSLERGEPLYGPPSGSGPGGAWVVSDLRADNPASAAPAPGASQDVPADWEPMTGWRRAMAHAVAAADAEVVRVTVWEDAELGAWWEPGADITARVVAAMCQAARAEPSVNAWYDPRYQARRCWEPVHIGVAMDTPTGLVVPVLRDAHQYSTLSAIREQLAHLKDAAYRHACPAEMLTGATILLSNFGVFAGRYADPLVIPPCVAILGVGRLRRDPENRHNLRAVALPLSLSVDHRAVTGGEATRFLRAVIMQLAQIYN